MENTYNHEAAVMPQNYTFQELKEFYMDARNARTITKYHISERVETREAECLKIWQESEESKQFPDAVQMIYHNPMYFLTRSNRIFSVWGKKVHEKKLDERSDRNKRLALEIQIDGQRHHVCVHQLVAEYFPTHTCVVFQDLPVEVHHDRFYSDESNTCEQLTILDQKLHTKLHIQMERAAKLENTNNATLYRCLVIANLEDKTVTAGALIPLEGNELPALHPDKDISLFYCLIEVDPQEHKAIAGTVVPAPVKA